MAEWTPLPPGCRLMIDSSHDGGIYGLVAVADGLVSGGGEGRLYRRTMTGEATAPAIGMAGGAGILSLAGSPDGHAVLAGTMAGAVVVDLARRGLAPVVGPTGFVRQVAWSAAGCLCGGDDKKLWFWSPGQAPRVLATGRGSLRQVSLLVVDDRPCALSLDGFRSLELRSSAAPEPPQWSRRDLEDGQAAVVAASDAAIAIAGDDGPIRLLDPATGATRRELPSPGGVTAMTWTPSGLVTGHRDLVLRRWSPDDGACLDQWPSHHQSWINVIVPVAGGYLTGDDSGDLHTPSGTIPRGRPGPIAVAWSAARASLLSSDGAAISEWNLATGEIAASWPIAHAVAIAASAGDLYFAELGGRIARYDVDRGEVVAEGRVGLAVDRLELSGDAVIATGDTGRAVALDAATLQPRSLPAADALTPGLRRDGDFWTWDHDGATWRAAWIDRDLVLEHDGRALVPPRARPRVKRWPGDPISAANA